jgi:hypothetical protein
VRARVLLVFLLLLAGNAAAGEPQRAAKLVVDFAPVPPAESWYAAGLEELFARELSRFAGIELTDKLDGNRCPGRDSGCLIEQYRARGVQVIVLGRVTRRTLEYQVLETWTGTRAFDGSLAVAGVTTSSLRRHLGELVRPIVQHGGLLDEHPVTDAEKPAATPPTAATPAKASGRGVNLLPLLLLALMAFVALPIGIARLLVRERELRKRVQPESWIWSAAVLAALGTLSLVTALLDVRGLWMGAAATPHAVVLLSSLVGGVLWGAFVLTNATWVLAPIQGLGQIRHDALWPLLRSYLALALLRGAVLLLYAPLLLLTLRACAALQLPERATWGLAVPAIGLLGYFWLLTLVDNLSLFLDVHLVIGLSTERNPWHGTLKRYFRGYVRRGAIELDQDLVERTLFLPSLLPNVISYGGGFARPRILVGEAAREAALGGLPEETEFPDRTINPEELPFGIVLPSEEPARPDELQREMNAERLRRRLTVAPARSRGTVPRAVGESATLLGWVLPQADEEGIPLIANDSDDYDVVKRLLTQHYAAFERNSDDDEVDDTDPTQKDFLFGALLREMGTLARRDTFFATLWYSLALAWPRTSLLYRLIIRPPLALYERVLSGPAARVADAYVALNQGLHHLIQYLAFLRGADEIALTARASAPELIQMSRDLLERLERDRPLDNERGLLAAHPRNRLRWLSQFFHAPLATRVGRAVRRFGVLMVAVAVIVLTAAAVRSAIEYHPVYLERVRSSGAQSTQGAAGDERTATQ